MNLDNISVAAVVFQDLTKATMRITKASDKPYFYLNTVNAQTGDYCLVHNGDKFGVVHVKRIIPRTDGMAVAKVTNILLSVVKFDWPMLREARDKITEFKQATEDMRTDLLIDQELGRVVPEHQRPMIENRGRRIAVDDDEIPF